MSYITLTDGKILHYRVEYNLTTLGGVAIPEHDYWFVHPQFLRREIRNRIDNGEHNLNPIETWGDIKGWLLGNWQSIRSSAYVEHLSYGVSMMFGVSPSEMTRTEAEQVFQYHAPEITDDTPIFSELEVRDRYGNRTNRNLLYSPEAVVETETQNYFFSSWSGTSMRCTVEVPRTNSFSSSSVDRWTQLNNYSYKMDAPPFLSMPNEKHSLYFGLELEMSTLLSPIEFNDIVTKMEPSQEQFFYFKSDSSVRGQYPNCMELVTVPMTPKRMKKEFKILFSKLQELIADHDGEFGDYFDTSVDLSNGIHIHVSREAFVYSKTPDDSRHAKRFLTVWNQWDRANLVFLNRLAKRPTETLNDNEYCSVHPAMEGRTLARRLALGHNGIREHRAATTQSPSTLEVRIFQGIVELNHVLQCIELVEAVFEYSQYAPKSKFGQFFQAYFTDWVEKQPGLRHAKELVLSCA